MRRTQIYLSDEQRRLLTKRARADGVSMAEVIRQAVDDFLLTRRRPGAAETLDRRLGALPKLKVPPRSEWDRGR